MKKYILFLMIFSLLTFSCNDEEESGSMNPVSNVTTKSFIGSVIVSWQNPSDENYYYTLISYTNNEGDVINKKIGRYDADSTGLTVATVSGFSDINDYVFSLTAVGFDGVKSAPVTVSGKPQSTDDAKEYVLGTVKAEPANMGAKLSWENISGVGVKLAFSYKDQNGVTQNMEADASETGSTIIDGGLLTKTEIIVNAQNKAGGIKTDSKIFGVTPLLNPDDLIDPNVEYLTFNGSGTRLTISQPNVYNPLYEYKIIATAADPYISVNGLKNPKAGNILVFRYKTTNELTLELFWCDAGGGAAGGRSTRVSVPKNKTGDWETFSYDYSADMATHKWTGKVGDFFRFDCGDNAGTTLQIRNIRFK